MLEKNGYFAGEIMVQSGKFYFKSKKKGTNMAKTICLAQYKGGTGKTSSTINIGASLVRAGYRVLAVDMDMQASLSVWLGADPAELPGGSIERLLTDRAIQAQDILVRTQEGLDLLPASLDLALVEFNMPSIHRETVLNRKIASIKEHYDFILIDTPPNFNICTLNAFVASDYLLIPFQPEPLCLYGLGQLTRTFEMVRADTGSALDVLGLFFTMYDGRITTHKRIENKVREDWGDLAFQTLIRKRTNILEATLSGQSSVAANPSSPIAQDYQALTEEVLARVHQ